MPAHSENLGSRLRVGIARIIKISYGASRTLMFSMLILIMWYVMGK